MRRRNLYGPMALIGPIRGIHDSVSGCWCKDLRYICSPYIREIQTLQARLQINIRNVQRFDNVFINKRTNAFSSELCPKKARQCPSNISIEKTQSPNRYRIYGKQYPPSTMISAPVV